ncbi:MAG: hypothetical protein ACLGSD_05165 [Acidobacteriota bacterium]
MRYLRLSIFLLVAPAAIVSAAGKHKTEAQADGFEGPVKSVSTTVKGTRVRWTQPAGPSLILPLYCVDCEYDRDGNRTRSGQLLPDGRFAGEIIEIVRDGHGQVIGRTHINGLDGSVSQREKDGPFGPVEESYYSTGQVGRSTKTYDANGNLADWRSFDANGQQISRSIFRTNADGQWTERATWGKNGQLKYRETYDPETDFQRFESYDESGAVAVLFTFSHNKMLSFWKASDKPNQFGDSFVANLGTNKVEGLSCRKDGTCDDSQVHYTYANSDHRFPISAEWRDASGKLLYATWCEYEFDDHHNWTKRTVWVLSPEVQTRTLLETDTRTIGYW